MRRTDKLSEFRERTVYACMVMVAGDDEKGDIGYAFFRILNQLQQASDWDAGIGATCLELLFASREYRISAVQNK